jgi:hypothetical protein
MRAIQSRHELKRCNCVRGTHIRVKRNAPHLIPARDSMRCAYISLLGIIPVTKIAQVFNLKSLEV